MATGYPRLVEGIAAIQVETGYVIEGGPRRELFTGRTARELFPRLLPLLDGTREVPQIADALGLSAPGVQRVIDVMRQRGVLDLAPEPEGAEPAATPMRTFLRRSLPAGQGETIDRRLRAAAVSVAGTGAFAELIAELLRRSGVGRVERCDGAPLGGADPAVDLVVLVEDPAGSPPDGTSGLPAAVALLRVRLRRGHVSVGPLVNAPGGGCARCAAAEIRDGCEADDSPASGDAAAIGLGAGLAAGAALRYLGGQGTSPAFQGVVEVGSADRLARECPVTRRPDCPECGRPGLSLQETEILEYAYEHAAETPPGGLGVAQLEAGDPRWPVPAKPYLTEPRLRVRRSRAAATGERASIGGDGRLAALSWMLAGAGPLPRRDGSPRQPCRAPAVGCPGSTRAYVLGDLTGAGPGVHYFDGSSGEFVGLSGNAATGVGQPDRLCVVLTGDLAALDPVLGPASRRVAYQDAGTALAQLDECARATGWRVYARQDPIDGLCALLDLNPEREIVTTVIDLQPGGVDGPLSTVTARRRLSGLLGRLPVTYVFDDGPIEAAVVARLARAGHAGGDAIWGQTRGSGPALGCVLYARSVVGLPHGLYTLDTASRPVPEPILDVIEASLRDRGANPPALLLFTGNLPETLAAYGAPGYPALLTKAAAAAGLVRLEACRAGLAAGLFARLPGWLAATSSPAVMRGHRVLYGCAIGDPSTHQQEQEREHIAW
jgi:hypothetical protein